jgi:hypothetical protein
MPDEAGIWQYRYSWSDGTIGDSGSFNSTPEGAKPGPWKIDQNNPYWFTDAHGKPFLPLTVFTAMSLTQTDWQDAINWANIRGYNTIVTSTYNTRRWPDGWANPTAFIKATGNPQGVASGTHKKVDPSRYNLKMWKEWDDMIKAAGEKGIYIGSIGGPSGKYGGRDGKYPPVSLAFQPKVRERFDTNRNKRLIKYIIARQGAFWNLAYWSLGGTEVYEYAVADEPEFQQYLGYFASLTPWDRMITAQDCEQWHDKERRWLSKSPVADTRKLNTLQTAVSSSKYPQWGKSNVDNSYWQEARPNNELALDSYSKFPMICTECLWEGQGRAEKPLRIIWGMLTAGAHTLWADWSYDDGVDGGRWGSIGKGWIPVKPQDEHMFKTTQLGIDTQGDEYLKHAVSLLSTLDYWKMRPQNNVVMGGQEAYCLADPGNQYLVYAPKGGLVSLSLPKRIFQSYWFDPRTGKSIRPGRLSGGDIKVLAPDARDWVLVVKLQESENVD